MLPAHIYHIRTAQPYITYTHVMRSQCVTAREVVRLLYYRFLHNTRLTELMW